MQTITKKPRGKILILERHRTPKGYVFRPNDQVDYYSIIEIKESCGCAAKTITLYKYYETPYGTIPTRKAKLL